MSLKAFHLLFIAMSTILAAFMAAWAVSQYRALHETGYIATAVASALVAAGLAVYGAKFQRKMRHL